MITVSTDGTVIPAGWEVTINQQYQQVHTSYRMSICITTLTSSLANPGSLPVKSPVFAQKSKLSALCMTPSTKRSCKVIITVYSLDMVCATRQLVLRPSVLMHS